MPIDIITQNLRGAWGPIYKVYTALLTQYGTDAPIATVLENTFSVGVTWGRSGVGSYEGTFTTTSTDRLYCQYCSNGSVGGLFIPISDYASIIGYFRITLENNSGNCTIYLEFIDAAFAYADMSDLFSTGGLATLHLPQILVFAA